MADLPEYTVQFSPVSPVALARAKAMSTAELLQRYKVIKQAEFARHRQILAKCVQVSTRFQSYARAVADEEAEYRAVESNPEQHRDTMIPIVAATLCVL